MDSMTKTHRFRVTFERIGTHHNVPPLETTAWDAQDLVQQIYPIARRNLNSKWFDVTVNLETMKGYVECGRFGTFTIEDLGPVDA